MTRRGLTTRLASLERRQRRDPWRPLVEWIQVVRPGDEGRRDVARGAGGAMYATVRAELTREGGDDLPIITAMVVSDEEGVAEAAGQRWHFVLVDDGAGGTVATVTGWDGTCWAGSREQANAHGVRQDWAQQ